MIKKVVKLVSNVIIGLCVIIGLISFAANFNKSTGYQDCLLDHIEKARTNLGVKLISKACKEKHPVKIKKNF